METRILHSASDSASHSSVLQINTNFIDIIGQIPSGGFTNVQPVAHEPEPEPLTRTSASSSWVAPLDSTLTFHFPLTSSQTVDATVELKRTRSSRVYLTVVLLIYSQISDPAA